MIQDTLPDAWRNFLAQDYDFSQLDAILEKVALLRQSRTVYPPAGMLFHTLELLAPQEVRVVILGQDPYIEENQAHGIAFSVPRDTALPPSLKNIFREYQSDLGYPAPGSGDLTKWVKNGVLLLNSILSVNAKSSASHKELGWEDFTDRIIKRLAEDDTPKVFILWGSFAQKKAGLIPDDSPHLVIKAVHPSPLSAYRGFFGSAPFSQAEKFLGNWQWPQLD